MNKNRVERTSANDLTAQVQENASELVRSVGDVAGKFIQEQPYTATLIAFGIGWLLGRMHRPLSSSLAHGPTITPAAGRPNITEVRQAASRIGSGHRPP
jgi:hypothetical protein